MNYVIGEVVLRAVRCQPDSNPMAARCSFDVIRSDYDVEGVEAGAHCVGPVPVIEGIGRRAVTATGWFPIGVSVADTGVGEARTAKSKDDEEDLLLRRGLRDGDDVPVVTERSVGEFVRVAKVIRMIGVCL